MRDIFVAWTFVITLATIIKAESYDPDVELLESHEERFTQFFLANDVENENQKIAIFLPSMGAKGYGLLKNLTTPVKQQLNSKIFVNSYRTFITASPQCC